MKQYEKEILQNRLDNEEYILAELEKVYKQAAKDCANRIAALSARTDLENLQSIIYQTQYQEALKAEIDGILNLLQSNSFKTVSEYLTACYQDGFIGTIYSLHKQGIPLIMPINQEAVIQAIQLDSKLSDGLYSSLGEDIAELKKAVRSEVSRGVSQGLSYNAIALGIAKNFKNTPFAKAMNRAKNISRTEGGRIANKSALDACYRAKKRGCNVLKQWDATLDGDTRESHSQCDGELRELDEKFSNGLMYPGDPSGGAGEVCNCRCCLLQRSRIALDEEELERLKERAAFFELDKSAEFEDFKKKYLNIYRSSGKVGDTDGYTTIDEIIPFDFSDKKKIREEVNKFFDTYSNAKVEHAVVISPTGQLFRLTGTKGEVNTSIVGKEALVGSIGMHNHPVWDDFDRGDSFSLQDVKFSVEYKTGIEYLITGDKKYSFEYTGDLSVDEIAEEYKMAKFKAMETAFENDTVLEFEQEETMRILKDKLEGFIFDENL